MSSPIDTRIVEMKFDNAAFEKGIKQSTASLENLDKTMTKFTGLGGGRAALKSGLDLVQTIASKLPWNSIQNGVAGIAKGIGNVFQGTFDAVKTASKAAIGGLTAIGAAVTGITTQGGVTRALNIEQARFQLKGLHVDWNDIQEDLDYAVKGTAYGLDSAAKAAAQLVASNVEVGDSMKQALRGISGVAAMTNSDYDSIADVFTTVAGNGRLMGDQLRQLSSRGLNVAATLGTALDKTEAEIRDMVSKGQIDFATFAKAMDDAFGEHAKAANETFTGAMSNVKAALSRIGAEFATPGLESLRKVFVSLIPVIDAVKKNITPIYELASSSMQKLSDSTTKFLDSLTNTDELDKNGFTAMDKFSWSIGRIAEELVGTFNAVKNIFDLVFGRFSSALQQNGMVLRPFMYDVIDATRSIREFAESMMPTGKDLMAVGLIIDGVVGTVSKAISAFKDFSGMLFAELSPRLNGTLLPAIESVIYAWNMFISGGISAFMSAAPHIVSIIANLVSIIMDVAIGISEGIAKVLPGFFELLSSGSGIISVLSDRLSGLINSTGSGTGVFNAIGETIGGLFSKVASFLPSVETFDDVLNRLIKTITNLVSELINLVKEADPVGSFFDLLQSVASGITDSIKAAADSGALSEIMSGIKHALVSFNILDIVSILNMSFLQGAVMSLTDTLAKLKTSLTNFSLARLVGLGPAMYEIELAFKSLQQNLQAKTILYIAAAVAAMAAALLALQKADTEKLYAVLPALMTLVASVSAAMISLKGLFVGNNTVILLGIAAALIALGLSVNLIASSLKKLSSLSWSELAVGAVGLLAVVGALSGLIAVMSKIGMVSKGAGVLMGAGISLLLIASALKVISSIKAEDMGRSLLAMTVMFGGLAGLMAVVGAMKGKFLAGAMAIKTVGSSMLTMSLSLKLLSTIPFEAMGPAIASMMSMLLGLVAAMLAMSKIGLKALVGAVAIKAAASALALMSLSLLALSTMSMEGMGTALIALGGGLAALCLAMMLMQGCIGGAAALVLASASLLMLAPALVVLSGIPLPGVAAALIALGGSLLILGIAARFIPIPSLLALSVGLLSIGAAAAVLGVGIAAAGLGLVMFATALNIIFGIIVSFSSSFADLVKTFATGLGEGIASFVQSLAENVPQIQSGMSVLMLSMLETIGSFIPAVVNLALQFVVQLAFAIANNIGPLVYAGLSIVSNLILGLAAGIGQLINAGIALIVAFVSGIGRGLAQNKGTMIQAMWDLINGMIQVAAELIASFVEKIPGVGGQLADGIRSWSEDVAPVSEEVAVEFTEATQDAVEGEAPDLGKSIMGTLGENLENNAEEVEPAGEAAANVFGGSFGDKFASMDLLKNVDISSFMQQGEPVGGSIGDGIATGVENSEPDVTGAVENVAQSAGEVDTTNNGKRPGDRFGQGFLNGIQAWRPNILEEVRSIGSEAEGELGKVLAEHSPSRVTFQRGSWFAEGFLLGISGKSKAVADAAGGMGRAASGAIGEVLSEMDELIDGMDWNSTPTVRPIFDGSDLERGFASINGMMPRTDIRAAGMLGYGSERALGSSSQSQTTNTYNITLDWEAGMDANDMVMALGNALRNQSLMYA